jgi:hypothetical protein
VNPRNYKERTTTPDAFSRGALTDTVAALQPSDFKLRREIEAILEATPIPKPPLHAGKRDTDFFHVSLPADTAEAIADALLVAEAEAVSADGSTTPQASHYAALVDMWTRYRDFLHRNQA